MRCDNFGDFLLAFDITGSLCVSAKYGLFLHDTEAVKSKEGILWMGVVGRILTSSEVPEDGTGLASREDIGEGNLPGHIIVLVDRR